MADISLVDVRKRFGAVEAVRNLSLSVADGELVVLLGPTGAGKTTTLRLIAGLERPDRGSVVIRGCEFQESKPQIVLGEKVRRAVISDNLIKGQERILNRSKGTVKIANNAND